METVGLSYSCAYFKIPLYKFLSKYPLLINLCQNPVQADKDSRQQ